MTLFTFWRRHRQPFPAGWEAILAADFAPYRLLSESDLASLRELVPTFLERTAFEGCNGQPITDRVRLTIAAYACLLLLHRPNPGYPRLGTVLVYPTSFAAPVAETDAVGIVTEAVEERLGESWEIGTLVLAWDSIAELCAGRGGGLNVILHEFAHQIDLAEGVSDGALLHDGPAGCGDWSDLLQLEYRRLQAARRRGRPAVLDGYGATSVAEFFAVATETFFERPVRLKAHHPELYRQLATIYRQDPAGWWLPITARPC
ncbi:MAG: zinc-dependent peptidase [Desulfuromonadales bacterium]|nr:zinc-dependent peptidase [Desulfuromonadales bacterium]